MAKAALRLSHTSITAPMDGTVVNLPVQEGQTVIAVQITPVMVTLANMDEITVRARVPEADIAAIQVGQVARFITPRARRSATRARCVSSSRCPERAGNAGSYNALRGGQQGPQAAVRHDRAGQHRDRQSQQGADHPDGGAGRAWRGRPLDVTVLDAKNEQKRRPIKTGLQDGARVQGARRPGGRARRSCWRRPRRPMPLGCGLWCLRSEQVNSR